MITDKEKKNRQHRKELKSLKNKMNGPNLVWFESLTKESQFDFLFEWKTEKKFNKLKKPEVTFQRKKFWVANGGCQVKVVKVIKYPPSLKHFIIKSKNKIRYRTKLNRKRDAMIDILLNKN